MKIRKTDKSDLDSWVELRHELWPDSSFADLRREAEEMLKDSFQEAFLLLDDSNRPAGFAEVAIHKGSEGLYGHLEGWYVAPVDRGKGFGRELVGAVEQWCLHRSISLLTSDTTPDYPESPDAHTGAGFKKLHEFTIFIKSLSPKTKLKPLTVSRQNDQYVQNYLNLRKAIGLIGVALPFVLAIGGLLGSTSLQTSLSSYYHTLMRDVFVGSLCAMAVFFWSYRGYDDRDNIAANIACVSGLGVALFPVAAVEYPDVSERVFEVVHVVSAAAFFLVLAGMSIFLFRLSDQKPLRKMKRVRNRVYLISGITILVCLAGIVLVSIPAVRDTLKSYRPVFWLESLAVFAFGVSWFVKGRTILKDR
jgi:GNAT superfamily N-acetyltransferase